MGDKGDFGLLTCCFRVEAVLDRMHLARDLAMGVHVTRSFSPSAD
jgi:hypothetical protein